MTDRRQIVRHLRMFNELGVQGVSRDASWRTRATAAEGDEAPAPVAIASGAGSVESEAGDPPLAREGAATVDSDAALAALKRGLRNSRMSSIGWALRRSHAAKAASSTAEAAKPARLRVAVQP